MKRNLLVLLIAVVAAASAFGAAAGIASAVGGDGDSSSAIQPGELTPEQREVVDGLLAPKIRVLDEEGTVRGTVNHEDLYVGGTNRVREGLLLAAVHNDNGDVVGYYSNLGGFIEKDIVEASPQFDHEQYLTDRGVDIAPFTQR